MKMEALISVVIPVYNVEEYLAKCLQSIINNTYRNLEIICVNDGSTDGSADILERFQSFDSRIIVESKENGGVSSARNSGLKIAKGDFLAFIDADDYIHPQYFELLMDAQKETSADIVSCDYYDVVDNTSPDAIKIEFASKKIVIKNRKDFFKNRALRSLVWGKLYRKQILNQVFFVEGLHYAEDSVFVADLWEKNPDAVCSCLLEKLYYYVHREGSLVHTIDKDGRFETDKLFAERALSGKDNQDIYLEQAIKRLLSTRYLTAYILLDKKIAKESNALLKFCVKELRKSDVCSTKMKLLYQMFQVFPHSYWAFRSIKEPNMRRWETVQKRQRREEKRHREV